MFESRRKFREEMEERKGEEQVGQILNSLVEAYAPDLVATTAIRMLLD